MQKPFQNFKEVKKYIFYSNSRLVGEEEDEVIVAEILRTSQIANGGGINTGPSQSNGIGQTVTADEIELTLERQPMEEDKTTGGIMDFPEDEAVVHLSASKRDQNDGEMILY